MRAISESVLQSRLDSGSKERLSSFRKRLSSDQGGRVFDYHVQDVLEKYALKPDDLHSVTAYLRDLKDPDGIPFARSIKEYSKMEDTWESFMKQERAPFTWNRHFKSALGIVMDRYSKAKLTALNYHSDSDIFDALTDVTTSTGWTGIITGKSKKREIIDGSFVTFQNLSQQAKVDGSFNRPMLPGVRTQCSGEFDSNGEFTFTCKHKTRPIWMVDVYVVIAERMWASPMTDWLKPYKYSAVGKDDIQISRIISELRLRNWSFISLDYSKYDSSIPSWLIHSAFRVLESAFTMQDVELLRVIEEDFINKNLVTGNGIVHVSHGDPSGSGLTTIINGICNELITETWMDYLGEKYYQYIIMGDDNLIYLPHQVDKEVISTYILHNFGVKVNVDKTNQGTTLDSPEFMSRFWTSAGPWRHPHELISLMYYPERDRKKNYDLGVVTPELVIYSYILGSIRGMRQLIDIGSFLRDAGPELMRMKWNEALLKEVPWNVRLAYETHHGQLPYVTLHLDSLNAGQVA